MKKMMRVLLLSALLFAGSELIMGFAPSTSARSLAWGYNRYPDVGDIGIFEKELQPHGKWISSRDYGRVWRPHKLSRNWRPYTRGRWIFTSFGWTWLSSEPWGNICFHYGRWYIDPVYGWVWYPDTVWAPAWVFWSTSGNWIGWAPIPPWVVWHHNDGFNLRGINLTLVVSFSSFSFCEGRHFLDDDLHRRISLPDRNRDLIRRSEMSVNINREDGRITNHLPVEGKLKELTGRPVAKQEIPEIKKPVTAPPEERQPIVFRSGPEAITRKATSIEPKDNREKTTSKPEEKQEQPRREIQTRRQVEPVQAQTQQQDQDKETIREKEGRDRSFGFGQKTRQTFSSRKR